MGEIGNSIAEAIRRRSTSAALGTYALFWLLMHWQGWYVTLFVKEDWIFQKSGMLKNEYVNQYFFGYHGRTLADLGWFLGWNWLAPLVLTVLFIWVVPRWFLIYAYGAEQSHKTAKRMIRLDEERKIATFEKQLANKRSEAVQAQIDLSAKAQEAASLDPRIGWAQEYGEFQRQPVFGGFAQVVNAVYQHAGHIQRYFDDDKDAWVNFQVSTPVLAMAHSHGLIEIDNGAHTIELTEKGRYFVSRFSGPQSQSNG